MKRGFSLIEIIVAIGIFGVIMTVALGALLSISLANKRAQAVRVVLDNVNFALENMARELRLGQNYRGVLGSGCLEDLGRSTNTTFDPGDCRKAEGIIFVADVNGTPTQFQYKLGGTAATGSGCLAGSLCVSQNGEPFFPLTSPNEIAISTLAFAVDGTGPDQRQPGIIINLSGVGKNTATGITADFRIQTTVTQRTVDEKER